MIAVYHYQETDLIYVINVESDEHHDFLEILDKHPEYPFPSGEIVFIENDTVVSRWDCRK
jgi:hypothetical protein